LKSDNRMFRVNIRKKSLIQSFQFLMQIKLEVFGCFRRGFNFDKR